MLCHRNKVLNFSYILLIIWIIAELFKIIKTIDRVIRTNALIFLLLGTFKRFLNEFPNSSITDLLNRTFTDVDKEMSQKKEIFAGTTVVVCFVRIEDRQLDGNTVRKVYFN